MKFTTGETLTGPAGTAVEITYDPDTVDRPDQLATVTAWFLHCPGQSPAWEHYLLATVHLRPIEEVKPAVINVPGATHEVLLLALDPAKDPVPTDNLSWSYLRPYNLVEQVEVPDDDAARSLLRMCTQAVVDGVLWAEPPLSGQKEPWRTSLLKTAAHLRGEEHAP